MSDRTLMHVAPEFLQTVKEIRIQFQSDGINISQEDVTRIISKIFGLNGKDKKIVFIIKQIETKKGGEREHKIEDYFFVEDMQLGDRREMP